MARPKSKDKRNAILAAAIQVIAEQGVGAPTAKIAQLAGVAEGTLFTYFNTKDELLNQIYLDLKTELREAVSAGYPKDEILKNRVRHTWQAYVDWGVKSPTEAQSPRTASRVRTHQRRDQGCHHAGLRRHQRYGRGEHRRRRTQAPACIRIGNSELVGGDHHRIHGARSQAGQALHRLRF